MKKELRRLIAIALSVLTAATVIPAAAEGGSAAESSAVTLSGAAESAAGNAAAEGEPEVVAELTELREEDTKHFLMSDGSRVAAKYDRAVHYLKDGEWKDADNSLTACEDSSGDEELKNRSDEYSVRFAKKSNKNKLVRLEKEKYRLDWSLSGAGKVGAEYTPENSADTGNPMALKNITGTVMYKDILRSTDISYTAEVGGVKENIVLKDRSAPESFSFEYKLKNLSFREAKGNIELFDPESPETVYNRKAVYV